MVWHPRLSMLGEAGLETLHGAALSILERTGLNVHHAEMRRRLHAAGARLGDDVRVYLPPELVRQALTTAKRDVCVYDRLGRPAMLLRPYGIHFGTGSDLLYTRDLDSGERRPSRLSDVARAARLCDALPDVDFVMSFAVPGEEPTEGIEPRQYYEMVANSVKPPVMTTFSGLEALERLHAMACLLAGSEARFRERPNYVLYGQFVSPLQHDQGAVERLIFCAEQEVPLIYIPTIMPGASGPVTLGGSLALAAAESLAGLVMQQVLRPGAPFIFGACVSCLDPRTLLFSYGSPEWRLNDLALAELARYYGLPVFGTGAASDAKVVDAQAGSEYATSLLAAALAGTNLIHDAGYLDSGLTGSLEAIVLAADTIRWVKRFLGGVSLDDESLALPVIEEVGPGRQFLSHDHTVRHFRESVTPYLAMDRDGYDHWHSSGAGDYHQRANAVARRLLEEHESVAVPAQVDAELRRLAAVG